MSRSADVFQSQSWRTKKSRSAPSSVSFDVHPAEQDVARRLHQPLAGDHALAVVLVLALAEVRLEHRRLRLLDLQEQRVVESRPSSRSDPAARAHAADADDLAGEVDHAELLEQVPTVLLQRPAVLAGTAGG